MTEQKRGMLPPTEKQLQRLNELIEHEAIAPHLDGVLTNFDAKLRTRGAVGVMLKFMKDEIKAWENRTL